MARSSKATPSSPAKKRGNPFRSIIKPFKDIWVAYRQIRTIDRTIDLYMALTMLGTIALGVIIGLLLGHPWWALLISLPIAFSLALLVLGRRGERAAYGQMEGQPGAGGAALSTLGKGWYLQQEPVAAEPGRRPNDLHDTVMVFRALGKPGVVLVGEGPRSRAERLLAKEQKRIERVAPGVPVHTFHVGQGEGSLAVAEVPKLIRRLKPAITEAEMSVVNKRLKSLPGVRQGMPAGMDPSRARVDRRAMRGK